MKKVLFSETIYEGRIIRVSRQCVALKPDHEVVLEIVHHPGGVGIVAIDSAGRVCLVRQYRHAVSEWLWELPAGKRDNDEPPLETASRELAEEAGMTAARWDPLGFVISSPGVFTEKVFLYLARDLTQGTIRHEEDELMEVHWYPFDDVMLRLAAGEITDAKTIIGLERAARYLGVREKLSYTKPA